MYEEDLAKMPILILRKELRGERRREREKNNKFPFMPIGFLAYHQCTVRSPPH
jgi:hypothetical protein